MFCVSLDDSEITYPFMGKNAKSKIATYQLKKSQLDFRLVMRCSQTGEFLDLNISCRSYPLLEGSILIVLFDIPNCCIVEEGTECKKSSIYPSL